MNDIAPVIDSAINHWAPQLHVGSSSVIPWAALKAIAHVETNYGARGLATLHEPAYCYGGLYYKGSADLQRLSVTFGCLAHQSYGPWQLLFMTAYELGYRGDPVILREPNVCAEYAVKLLNVRTLDKIIEATVEDVFDAWNSGHARDRFIPAEYIKKAKGYYLAALAGGTGTGPTGGVEA